MTWDEVSRYNPVGVDTGQDMLFARPHIWIMDNSRGQVHLCLRMLWQDMDFGNSQ